MTHKEPDYETVILLKLGAMERQLKSLMTSLGEPLRKKGGVFIPVSAPVGGKVQWVKSHGTEVEEGWAICTIEYDPNKPDRNVPSPADGTLLIIVTGGEVSKGMHIADIQLHTV